MRLYEMRRLKKLKNGFYTLKLEVLSNPYIIRRLGALCAITMLGILCFIIIPSLQNLLVDGTYNHVHAVKIILAVGIISVYLLQGLILVFQPHFLTSCDITLLSNSTHTFIQKIEKPVQVFKLFSH